MKISVTKQDIASGIPDNICECPIALAIKRAICATNVSVAKDLICISSKNIDRLFSTPKIASEFINAFDDNRRVEPFEFELEISDESEED